MNTCFIIIAKMSSVQNTLHRYCEQLKNIPCSDYVEIESDILWQVIDCCGLSINFAEIREDIDKIFLELFHFDQQIEKALASKIPHDGYTIQFAKEARKILNSLETEVKDYMAIAVLPTESDWES